MKTPAITVLSPSYNKGKTIRRTYESLLKQTSYDFEWLLINDGSTDDTDEIVVTFHTELFPIRYINKTNEGLSRTFNLGVELSLGSLVFRLDTDDYVKEDAIESILKYRHLIENEDKVCGLVFLSVLEDNNLVGIHPFKEEVQRSNFFDYRYKYHAVGDRAEVVKTSVFKEIPYPVFEGEKFCLESAMWNTMSLKYDAFYINKDIYVREYNGNSITSAGASTYIKNPYGAMVNALIILQRVKISSETYKVAINYFRYSLRTKKSLLELIKAVPYAVSIVGLFPGILLYCLDNLNPSIVSSIKSFFKHNQ